MLKARFVLFSTLRTVMVLDIFFNALLLAKTHSTKFAGLVASKKRKNKF